MATGWVFGDKVTRPGGEIDYTLVGGFMVARRLGVLQISGGLVWLKASYFPWARKFTWPNANNESLLAD